MNLSRRFSTAFLVSCLICAGAMCRQHDSTQAEPFTSRHVLEIGINPLGAGFEYRYQWLSWMSSDAIVSASEPGIALGITILPIPFFFLQGVVGTGAYKETQSADGPPAFKPDYVLGWKAGIHFPIAPRKTRMYLLLAAGDMKFVQNNYNYNGGGFLLGTPPAPVYGVETRIATVYSVSLGFQF